MTPIIVGVIGIAILFLLMFFNMPIGFAMAFIGFTGVIYLGSIEAAFAVMGMEPFSQAASYIMSVLGMFILMGEFAFNSGLSERLYYTANKWLGHLPGGLAIATVAACAGFSAICGSSIATAATMGSVVLPEMKKFQYKNALATGCVAAGGTLGILIPPSNCLIVYALLTEQSIVDLYIASLLPGVLLAALFTITIIIQVKLKPNIAPMQPIVSVKEKMKSVTQSVDIMALFVLMMGGLYGGLFTANEAGAIGAGGALLISIVRRSIGTKSFLNSISSTVQTTAMVMAIVIGAMIFNRFLAITMIPMMLAGFVSDVNIPALAVVIVMFIIYLALGCFMDGMAMMLLTMPIFFPVIVAANINPIWFGVIVVIVMEMAAITPPVGMNVFVIAGVARDVPMNTIFRGIFPFMIPLAICALLVMVFPSLALFLPGTMN
jgi:tripartite ATP-independent transporter DctM subunit